MRKSYSAPPQPNRRNVILGGTSFVGLAALPNVSADATEPGLGSAAEFLAAMRKFMSSLEPDKRKTATFAWNGAEWNGWNYFGVGGYIKPGLRLEQMSQTQKATAWDLLTTLLSPVGIAKTKNVMTLQDVLASLGNGAGERSSERFSFAVFGAPAETGAWGFRIEGHHLSQSIAVRDGRIISVTPSSFSANPNRVPSGKHAGLVTLNNEEVLARTLIADLSPKLQAKVRLSDTALRNILSYAGRERVNAKKEGLAVAELTSAQRDLIWQLIETYAVEYLAPPLAAAQRERVRLGDRDAVHFAWYGPNTPEKAFGYRVIGDGFVVEMGSVDPAAQHLHTIYHDLGSVLGRTA
ncbi:MAG: DUF3500 domain-containing protein [Rhizobiales bacterium]|nr:DUF3500 domain-containing protein [Hyphomicrobiales bacterium]